MKLSVVITAFDHHDITVAHARECMNASIVPDEIIVVNDAGTPDLREKLSALPKKTKLIYARINERIVWNYIGACNLGFWLSRGDFISIEDNDNIPHKDFYESSLKVMEDNKEVGMVFGKIRYDISEKDLDKSQNEWKILAHRGPNRGTYLIRREVYSQLKGQDEQFCGRYGWMYYDWKRRLLAITKFSQISAFYYVVEGQSNLSHHNDPKNYSFYHKGAREGKLQSPVGILNFTFTAEEL